MSVSIARSCSAVAGLILCILVTGCLTDGNDDSCPGTKYPSTSEAKVTVDQGLWGDVWFWAGNFMPGCPTGTITPVSRQLFVHALTHLDDVEMIGSSPFYSAIHTELIGTVTSDPSGFYQIALPPGEYSLFVQEDTLYYANMFDGGGHIMPVSVVADSATNLRFDITHQAAH